MRELEEKLSALLNQLAKTQRQIKATRAELKTAKERNAANQKKSRRERNEQIVQDVLTGSKLTDVANIYGMSSTCIRAIVDCHCTKVNRSAYESGMVLSNHPVYPRRLPPPLAWLRENAQLFMET